MRERDINRKLFHKGHYEIIAARFRDALTNPIDARNFYKQDPVNREMVEKCQLQIGVIVDLALSMAKRFALDNEDFEPEMFLDRCSPDAELYPLSELWNGVNKTEEVSD